MEWSERRMKVTGMAKYVGESEIRNGKRQGEEEGRRRQSRRRDQRDDRCWKAAQELEDERK